MKKLRPKETSFYVDILLFPNIAIYGIIFEFSDFGQFYIY